MEYLILGVSSEPFSPSTDSFSSHGDIVVPLGLNDTLLPAEAHQDQLMIGGVPPHPGPDYFCHLCPFEGTFKEVASHHIGNHKDSVLNFYKRVISADTGKIAKQAFEYKYIPRDIESQGYEFEVGDHQESIKIVKCNRTHDRSTQTGHNSQDQCVGTRDHGDSDLQSRNF